MASRDIAGPTTRLAVVAKAGSRYQPAPGLTTGLEQFAFKVRPNLHWNQFALRTLPSNCACFRTPKDAPDYEL